MTDWIEWNGGECPVPDWQRVEIRQRSGRTSGPYSAENLVWGRWVDSKADRDIVAYRVFEQDDWFSCPASEDFEA